MFKVDISAWLQKEIHWTELELLRAEDELANAQLRVDALQQRITRLKNHAEMRPANEAYEARARRRRGSFIARWFA